VVLTGEKGRLKPGAVPSIFVFRPPDTPTPRSERKRRRILAQSSSTFTVANHTDVGCEVEVGNTDDVGLSQMADEEQLSLSPSSTPSVGCQCELLKAKTSRMSVYDFKDNASAIQYYSRFDNYDHFIMFFEVLGPAAHHLSYKCSTLEPADELFLTLTKLRQAKDNFELGLFFGISQTTVSCIVRTWINFLYFQLKEINTWPSKKIVQQHMPDSFGQMFGNTRVILDATEVPIAKPKDVNAQSSSFSTYKNRNTLKTMIGCTPRGLISFVGDSYGESASDRQLIETSELYTDSGRFEAGDSIMADRGIMVQDLFANKNVSVNTHRQCLREKYNLSRMKSLEAVG